METVYEKKAHGLDCGPCLLTSPGTPHLQFEAAQHGKEDKGEAEDTDGQAHQTLEEQPLPRWVVELFCVGHWADALHTLQRKEMTRLTSPRVGGLLGDSLGTLPRLVTRPREQLQVVFALQP